MTEELKPTEERADKGKVISSFTILKCKTDVIETPDGKRHFESECLDKHARDYFSSCFEEEAILRINPKVILGEPPVEPPVETPVTES
ncbi:unnamed protein product [marine sediment metagenome]|uniref:Uncharacterized protein n=1 Tax=marine sediment metagenome TaxID=412755 RepID=X1LG82_9ZZZZ